MENKGRNFYNAILTEHNLYPAHKHELSDATAEKDGVNPSCGDAIRLKLKVENGVIADGSFVGDGCAVSQASADIMLDMIIGKSAKEAQKLSDTFLRMIRGEATEAEIESLEEAGALADVAHMPARVKCAVLGWHTLQELLQEPAEGRASGTKRLEESREEKEIQQRNRQEDSGRIQKWEIHKKDRI